MSRSIHFCLSPGDQARPFIPAKIVDNPYLDQAEYRQSLAELDEDTRRQLEDGIWDEPIPEGAYYKKQIEKAEAEGRITNVPFDPLLPVYTYWDLETAKGRDSMTVGFVRRFVTADAPRYTLNFSVF